MLSPRWIKLLRDAQATPGRIALMVLAIAAGVCGMATMLSSYTILSRETTRNYLDTNPPSATMQLDRIDAPLMAAVALMLPAPKRVNPTPLLLTVLLKISVPELLPMVEAAAKVIAPP